MGLSILKRFVFIVGLQWTVIKLPTIGLRRIQSYDKECEEFIARVIVIFQMNIYSLNDPALI